MNVRGVEWGIHSEFDGFLMPRFGFDVPELANVGSERCKSFRGGDNRQVDNRDLGAVCEDGGGCRGLVIWQRFWVDDYLERAICIGLEHLWSCDLGITAPCVNVLDTEWRLAYVSCCYGSCYRSFPFWERSEVNPLWGQDEFGCGSLSVVDEEDDKSRDEQYGNDDGCEECTFGHGLVSLVLVGLVLHYVLNMFVYPAERAGVRQSLVISFISGREELKVSASNI